MAPLSNKHGPFRQCTQMRATLLTCIYMYTNFGYTTFLGLFQDKDSQGIHIDIQLYTINNYYPGTILLPSGDLLHSYEAIAHRNK